MCQLIGSIDTVRNYSSPYESARHQNYNCRRSIVAVPKSRSAERALCPELLVLWLILSVFQRTISCLHVDFECFKLALMTNFCNLRQAFMNFWSFLTRPGDKHDEGISSCSWTPRESHNFLTFLTTRLPISWFLGKYHSEMKCFFGWIKTEMFTDAESQLILLTLKQRNCKPITAVSRSLRDGFARHLRSIS